jgi:hypothetical protein
MGVIIAGVGGRDLAPLRPGLRTLSALGHSDNGRTSFLTGGCRKFEVDFEVKLGFRYSESSSESWWPLLLDDDSIPSISLNTRISPSSSFQIYLMWA